jgi:glycosyltransferase involved in cell wall biosynthesis
MSAPRTPDGARLSPFYPDVFVVIPALDEEESLGAVIASLPRVKGIAVVDNGSTDRTVEVAQRALEKRPNAVVISEPRRGYGAACLAGIRAAVPFEPEVLVILDADESTDVSDLGAIVDPIRRGDADMVLGDRTERAEPHALTPVQRFGNVLATHLMLGFTSQRSTSKATVRNNRC